MPRKKHSPQTKTSLYFSILKTVLFLILGFIAGALCQQYWQLPDPTQSSPPSSILQCPEQSFTVTGRVMGDPLPDSMLYLYSVNNTSYSTVMAAIRSTEPTKKGWVNATQGFRMECLSPGNYALVIPSSSYNGSVGSPLPYEWVRDNYRLDIAFQGGDYEYAVGAFSIEKVSAEGQALAKG